MSPDDRTYDRDQVDLILRTAAQADDTAPRTRVTGRDGLTVWDIQDIGAQAGISASAVSSAALAVALASAKPGHQLHHVHTIRGELRGDAWHQLADTMRSAAPDAEVRREGDALELDLGDRKGRGGCLRLSVRSSNGETTVSIWSDAPHLAGGELASLGLLGAPVALFPLVAVNAGNWPAIGVSLMVGAAGALLGTGATIAWQRRAAARWQGRISGLLAPIVSRAESLARTDD